MAIESTACIFCRQAQLKNNTGLYVKGRYICPECEGKIIMLTRDDPDYDYYKWGLKKIWY